MPTSLPSLRPRLTLAILAFAAIDIAGMLFLATGIMWFAHGKPLFIPDYPTGPIQAGSAIAAGLLLMFWAAGRILRELLGQRGRKEEPER